MAIQSPLNRVSSIMVLGLQAASQYVSTFTVEVYLDADLTELVATDTAGATWDGIYANQSSIITFSGLVFGRTYYVRAGTSTPYSPEISWQVPYAIVAGESLTIEGVTYSGSYTATVSGVTYVITPSGAPADIDHYEACYFINDSSVPAKTATYNWKGNPGAAGNLTFGFVARPGDQVYTYLRAVNTSGDYQDWAEMETITVSTITTYGSLDEIPDGTVYAKTLASGLTNGAVDPRKTTGVLKLGSLSPVWSGSLYWSATANSSSSGAIQLWWDQLIFKRIDGTQTVVGALPQANAITINGLGVSSSDVPLTYDLYPYLDENLITIGFLNTGDSGSPAYCYNDSNLTLDSATSAIAAMNRQDRVGLGPIQIVMPIYVAPTSSSSQPIYMSGITAYVWGEGARGVFGIGSGTSPLFTQSFNSLMFNTHPNTLLPGDPHDSGNTARPVVNNAVASAGSYAGDITVAGNGYSAWEGATNGFQMSCVGTFTVANAGNISFTPYSEDGWLLAIQGASLASAWSSNNLGGVSTTPVQGFPVLVGRNARDHAYDTDSGNPFTIHFPAAGTYNFELCWAGGDNDIVECCLMANGIAIPPFNASTGGGGSGTGTGTGGGGYSGGGGQCPRSDQLVEERTLGIIAARDVQQGHSLRTLPEFGDWIDVIWAKRVPNCWWVRICSEKGGTVVVHPQTHIPLSEGEEGKVACELSLSDTIRTDQGVSRITSIELLHEDGERVMLTCSAPKVFLCGSERPSTLIHNIRAVESC